MATTKTRKISRHKLAVIQAYAIIALFVLFGLATGYMIGRCTAPKEIETVTITETVEIPTYEADKLPEVTDITYFDVPLSHSLQRYIFEVCADEGVPVALVMAMIDQESRFNPEAIGNGEDYGLMQINEINHEWLEEDFRCANMTDPYQNVFCGIKIIGSHIERYDRNYVKALMAYNMGDYGMRKAWESGVKTTDYTIAVIGLWEYYEEEMNNAKSSDGE